MNGQHFCAGNELWRIDTTGRWCALYAADGERLLYEGFDRFTAHDIADWYRERTGLEPQWGTP